MLGVMTVGVLPGVLVAVGLALLRLLAHAAFPPDSILGLVHGKDGTHAATLEMGGRPVPGLMIYGYGASLVFFNAEHFQGRVRTLLAGAAPRPEWLLLDAESVNLLDVTGAETLDALRAELAGQGVVLAIARGTGEFGAMLERSGVAARIGPEHLFPSVAAGALAFQSRRAPHGAH
jgi:MFS superfamily sulfate permease-like transporter